MLGFNCLHFCGLIPFKLQIGSGSPVIHFFACVILFFFK